MMEYSLRPAEKLTLNYKKTYKHPGQNSSLSENVFKYRCAEKKYIMGTLFCEPIRF